MLPITVIVIIFGFMLLLTAATAIAVYVIKPQSFKISAAVAKLISFTIEIRSPRPGVSRRRRTGPR